MADNGHLTYPKNNLLNFWGTSSGYCWPYIILLFKCFSNDFFYFIEKSFVDMFADNNPFSAFESNTENCSGNFAVIFLNIPWYFLEHSPQLFEQSL